MVLLFRAPLAVVEDDRGDRNSFADAGLQLTEAHAPGPIADVGDRRSLGRGHLGTDDGGKRVATVAEAHRREHRARALEAKIRIRDRADVADVGRHHGVIGHCALELAEHLARMHMARIFRDFERPRVLFLRPAVELGFPRSLFRLDRGQPRLPVRLACERPAGQPRE